MNSSVSPVSEHISKEIMLEHTSTIVAAYVQKGDVDVAKLPELIETVHSALTNLGKPVEIVPEAPVPAVPVKKSVFPDYIICLEDGKKLKMLKRHIQTAYNMTPEQYREKWGLPASYPMTAPNYAKRRSELAQQIGLGRKPETPETPETPEPEPEVAPAPSQAEESPKKRTRRRATA